GWSEAVKSLLDRRFDDLVAHRQSDPNPRGDCLGWSELLRDVVLPLAQRLADKDQLSARLLDPAWAYFASGGPAYDDLFRACTPRPPDTELLILNHAMLPDWLRGMSSAEILTSELGICRLLQYALGCSLLSALLTPIARRLADAGQLSPRLLDPVSEILSSEQEICRLLQHPRGCSEGLTTRIDPAETATSRKMKRWPLLGRYRRRRT
ncbi:MAG TPA: hypothetical protein VGR16_13250, partial [Thermomicrobiales bacterium]|nr:hypothetical protein [Thermomicrobiales bacterium]